MTVCRYGELDKKQEWGNRRNSNPINKKEEKTFVEH